MNGEMIMALIKCAECGKEISDKSEVCIHCGYPIKKEVVKEEIVMDDSEVESQEEQFFTICKKCGNFNFTNKLRIDNTIKSQGYPTCMWCGGKIKILAGKTQWMKKSKEDKDNIAQEELQKVKRGDEYDEIMANQYGKENELRPDLDMQGYCPRCAMYYPKSKAIREGRINCEFCGTTIKYSNMLTMDFAKLFKDERDRLGLGVPDNDVLICDLIRKTFLLDDEEFDETIYDKRIRSLDNNIINNKINTTNQNNNNSNISSISNSTSTDTENVIWMWVGLIGAAVCFLGFILNDHEFLAFITTAACIAFGMWRSTKLSPEMQKQMGEIEKQKEIEKKRRTENISCPYCKSHNVQKISVVGRAVSASAMGLASSKIGKQWHCNNCRSDF